MASFGSLPADLVFAVCERIVQDPEPLHTLSARVRTLGALRLVCHETDAVVRDRALPLLAAQVGADGGKKLKRPTLERIAYADDIAVGAALVVHGFSQPNGFKRKKAVDALLLTGKLWELAPLKRELGRRRAVLLDSAAAQRRFRLTPDVSRGPLVREEDAKDAALARHGSSAGLAVYDARTVAATEKRRATVQLRNGRETELTGAVYATNGDPDWFRLYPDLKVVKAAFLKVGGAAAFDAAIELHWRRRAEVDARSREVRDLISDPTTEADAVKGAVDAYVAFGAEKDRDTIVGYLGRWRSLVDVWAGARFDPVSVFGPRPFFRRLGGSDAVDDYLLVTEGPSTSTSGLDVFRDARRRWDALGAGAESPTQDAEDAAFLSPQKLAAAMARAVPLTPFPEDGEKDAAWVVARATEARRAEVVSAVARLLVGRKKLPHDTERAVAAEVRVTMRTGLSFAELVEGVANTAINLVPRG